MYPDKKQIEQATGTKILVFDEVSSTNDVAKEIIKSVNSICSAIISRTQTGGHGRGDKHFFSYDGGIYMSIILPEKAVSVPAELVTSACAAAVCRAVRAATDAQVEIKWVNDLYLHSRKVCGILALRVDSAYIIGVGINVREVTFPEDICATAAALCSDCDMNMLASEIIKQILSAVTETPAEIIEYCSLHSYVLGKTVTYIKNGKSYSGFADRLLPRGELHVKFSDGGEDILSSGEISVKIV